MYKKYYLQFFFLPQADRLKRLPANEKCKVAVNGKILSILFFLFEKEYLKNLTWGQKNGADSTKSALVNFPLFGVLMKQALEDSNVDPEKLRRAIQAVFKAHVKKL